MDERQQYFNAYTFFFTRFYQSYFFKVVSTRNILVNKEIVVLFPVYGPFSFNVSSPYIDIFHCCYN